MTSTAPLEVDDLVDERLARLARFIEGPDAKRLPRHLLGSLTRSTYLALVPDARRAVIRTNLKRGIESALAEVAASRPGGQA